MVDTSIAAIRLLPIEMRHAEAMHRWMLDPEVSRNVGLRTEPSLQKTLDWIAQTADASAFLALAIYSEDRHVGNVVFDQISENAMSARLSIYIGASDERDKGLGTMAMQSALTQAFLERDFQTIWLTVNADNARARHVYAKLGFQAAESGRMELLREVWFKTGGLQ